MKAALFREVKKPLSIEEIETPTPGPGEVLIRNRVAGVCHTDLAVIEGEFPPPARLPIVLGHEIAGEIVEVGEGVEHLKVGDRVVLSWLYHTCGRCEYCLSGREHLCRNRVETGFHVNGGYAEYVLAKASHVLKIPEEVPWEYAPSATDAIATPYKGCRLAGLREGELVTVWGVGGLGMNAIQVAKAFGARVVAVDIIDWKLEEAERAGADHVVNPEKEDPVEYIKGLGGADVALTTLTTYTMKPFEQAYESLKDGGRLVLIGLPPGKLALPVIDWVLREIKVVGSLAFTRYDISESLRLLAEGKVKPRVTKFKFEEINEALEKLKKGEVMGRAILTFE